MKTSQSVFIASVASEMVQTIPLFSTPALGHLRAWKVSVSVAQFLLFSPCWFILIHRIMLCRICITLVIYLLFYGIIFIRISHPLVRDIWEYIIIITSPRISHKLCPNVRLSGRPSVRWHFTKTSSQNYHADSNLLWRKCSEAVRFFRLCSSSRFVPSKVGQGVLPQSRMDSAERRVSPLDPPFSWRSL